MHTADSIYGRAKFTVLFSHANAEDLGLIFDHLKTLKEVLQVNVMGYEYTGYGRSTGTPSETDCYADITAAFSWLVQEKNLLPSEVILYGRSIGSGPSVELASRAEVGGVILQSAFTSCIRVAYDLKYTAFDAFCNIKKIHKIKCPVLIIHGTRDDVVTLQHGKELFKLCRRPHRPFWVCTRLCCFAYVSVLQPCILYLSAHVCRLYMIQYILLRGRDSS